MRTHAQCAMGMLFTKGLDETQPTFVQMRTHLFGVVIPVVIRLTLCGRGMNSNNRILGY